MLEDYLHYLWGFQKWKTKNLQTSDGVKVSVLSTGSHNLLSGPDFFNARVVIGDQEWAGNVEIHLKSSDWYMHGHEKDPAYDNVILHVVWDHDWDIFRKDGTALPVMELKDMVSQGALKSYERLVESPSGKWINCENDFALIDDFVLKNWLERIYFERLEERAKMVSGLLDHSAGDWEEVLFKMLAKNFGLNVNGDAFLSIAGSVPFSVIRKLRGNLFDLEALLLGQAGLLGKHIEEPYFLELKNRFSFLQKKFGLRNDGTIPVKYFRLRPDNFPEIRLMQLAAVYHEQPALFSKVVSADSVEEIRQLFSATVSDFWKCHYTFSKSHALRKKSLTPKFIDLLIINTLVPLKFSYAQHLGKEGHDALFQLMASLDKESNQVIEKFNSLRPLVANNSLDSQALLQLKKEYCDKKRCLRCAIGTRILEVQEQM